MGISTLTPWKVVYCLSIRSVHDQFQPSETRTEIIYGRENPYSLKSTAHMLCLIVFFGDNKKNVVKQKIFILMEDTLFASLVYLSYNAKPEAHLFPTGELHDYGYF